MTGFDYAIEVWFRVKVVYSKRLEYGRGRIDSSVLDPSNRVSFPILVKPDQSPDEGSRKEKILPLSRFGYRVPLPSRALSACTSRVGSRKNIRG